MTVCSVRVFIPYKRHGQDRFGEPYVRYVIIYHVVISSYLETYNITQYIVIIDRVNILFTCQNPMQVYNCPIHTIYSMINIL